MIDLDAALDTGANDFLVRRICRELPCRVGGGIRTIERARRRARRRRPGGHRRLVAVPGGGRRPRVRHAPGRGRGIEHVIAAVDSFHGRVVVRGWREATPLTAVEAVPVLEPYCERVPLHARGHRRPDGRHRHGGRARGARRPRRGGSAPQAASRPQADIDALDAMGIDAVVGMAIYTGTLKFAAPGRKP